MRIAMFTDSYRPQINGLVTSMELFREELEKRGHKIIIFAPKVPNYRDKNKNVHRMASVKFANYKEYRIGIPVHLLLKPMMKDVSVIHIHSPFSVGMAGLMLSKHYDIPCVATFHTMFNKYQHYFIKSERLANSRRFKKLFENLSWRYMRWFYNSCDAVIAPSRETMQVLKKNGVKNVVVIPTGTSYKKNEKNKKYLRRKYGFSVSEKIILHVGRITREKNMDFIIRSLEGLLKNENEKVKFVITSDGPHKEQLVDLVKSIGLQKRIIFTGYISEQALRDYYSMADVFVMASKTETQGLVLLDAAKNRLPCVVTNTPVIADFVRENGVGIVSAAGNFEKSVGRILNDGAARKRIESNCNRIREKYSIEKCTDALLKLYSQIQ